MRDNVAEVKVVLASVALALAVYQLVLIAVGYGKMRPPFLGARPALTAHRSVGDAIAGSALLTILTLKLAVVRRGLGLGRALPLLGISVFTLLAVTWAGSAGEFLS
jgi:hypothetical protein